MNIMITSLLTRLRGFIGYLPKTEKKPRSKVEKPDLDPPRATATLVDVQAVRFKIDLIIRKYSASSSDLYLATGITTAPTPEGEQTKTLQISLYRTLPPELAEELRKVVGSTPRQILIMSEAEFL